MDDRFEILKIRICPVEKLNNGNFHPNLEYPKRICVIDNEKEIAIDIKTKLKYDYVKTVSYMFFVNKSYQKIKENKRVAINSSYDFSLEQIDLLEIEKIINDLKLNQEFLDGNIKFNNQQYLEYLTKERLEEENKLKNEQFIEGKKQKNKRKRLK